MGAETGIVRLGPLRGEINERLRTPYDMLPLWLESDRPAYAGARGPSRRESG
jgi:hypothetical protein